METRYIRPSAGAVARALVLASTAAATPTLLFGPYAVLALPFGVLIAGAHALLFALPAYLLLRRRRAIGWVTAVFSGGLIGAAPELIFGYWLFGGSLFRSSYLDWLADSWVVALVFGLCGIIGGTAFRAALGEPREEVIVDPSIFD